MIWHHCFIVLSGPLPLLGWDICLREIPHSTNLFLSGTYLEGVLRDTSTLAWRAARAVGDHDLNSFFLRADPIDMKEKLEPGMTVWLIPGQRWPAVRVEPSKKDVH